MSISSESPRSVSTAQRRARCAVFIGAGILAALVPSTAASGQTPPAEPVDSVGSDDPLVGVDAAVSASVAGLVADLDLAGVVGSSDDANRPLLSIAAGPADALVDLDAAVSAQVGPADADVDLDATVGSSQALADVDSAINADVGPLTAEAAAEASLVTPGSLAGADVCLYVELPDDPSTTCVAEQPAPGAPPVPGAPPAPGTPPGPGPSPGAPGSPGAPNGPDAPGQLDRPGGETPSRRLLSDARPEAARSPEATVGSVPATGANVVTELALGLGLVILGGSLVVLSRTRRRHLARVLR